MIMHAVEDPRPLAEFAMKSVPHLVSRRFRIDSRFCDYNVCKKLSRALSLDAADDFSIFRADVALPSGSGRERARGLNVSR